MRRGVQFEAAGARHELRFDVNALCQLEADFGGVSIEQVAGRLVPGEGKSPRMTDIRAAFRAALGAGITTEAAGDIMSEIGMAEATRLIGEAMALAFPSDDAERQDAGKPRAVA